MKKHYIGLFRYDLWATNRLLSAVKTNEILNEEIMKLLSHVISAQLVWLHRIQGLPTSPFPIWEVYKIRELESMVEESNNRWCDFLETYKIDTLEEIIHYKNSKGDSYENTLRNILDQVILHGMHHRGQVSLLLREEGVIPPPNDFIVYKRL